jgi:hypothetical protein
LRESGRGSAHQNDDQGGDENEERTKREETFHEWLSDKSVAIIARGRL